MVIYAHYSLSHLVSSGGEIRHYMVYGEPRIMTLVVNNFHFCRLIYLLLLLRISGKQISRNGSQIIDKQQDNFRLPSKVVRPVAVLPWKSYVHCR